MTVPLPDTDTELEALLVTCARARPHDNPLDDSPWDALPDQPAAVIAERVRPVLLRLACADDAHLQRRALSALVNLPADPDATAAVLALAPQAERFRRDPGLAHAAAHAVATLGAGAGMDREAAAFVRALVAPGLPPAGAITPLAIFEPGHVEVALAEAGAEAPVAVAAGAAAMFALYHRDRLLALLGGLTILPLAARATILERLTPFLHIDDERGRTLALRMGLPAPTSPPSLERCRRALGLPAA